VLAPPLTIAQEWERDHHWEDGTTVPRSSSDEWDYVWKQAAVEGRGGVPGFDEGHAGMKIADFRQLFVKLVATVGGSTKLIPTMQEVAACRIYTGPAHAKINSFMRMVSDGDAGRSAVTDPHIIAPVGRERAWAALALSRRPARGCHIQLHCPPSCERHQ